MKPNQCILVLKKKFLLITDEKSQLSRKFQVEIILYSDVIKTRISLNLYINTNREVKKGENKHRHNFYIDVFYVLSY